MPHDPGLAQILRDDLTELPVREQKMFGALCFLLNGHMICGTHAKGALFRVGKPNMAAALALPGTRVMSMAGRDMQGFLELDAEALKDETRRAALLAIALGFVKSLPPK